MIILVLASIFWGCWFLWPWVDYLMKFRLSTWVEHYIWNWLADYAGESNSYSWFAPFDFNDIKKNFRP